MSSREWFMLGVRLMGGWIFYQSLAYWVSILDRMFFDVARRDYLYNQDTSPLISLVFAGTVYTSVACTFLLGTGRLAALVYGPEPVPYEDGPAPDDTEGPADNALDERDQEREVV